MGEPDVGVDETWSGAGSDKAEESIKKSHSHRGVGVGPNKILGNANTGVGVVCDALVLPE